MYLKTPLKATTMQLSQFERKKNPTKLTHALCAIAILKKSLHSDNVHICRTTVCSNVRHVNVSPSWMFSISPTHKPRVTASFVHWALLGVNVVSSSILSGYFACC